MAEPGTAAQPAEAVPLRPGLFTADETGRLRLAGSRCPQCGACYFPPRLVCARCLSAALETVALSRDGVVYTYTVVHQSTPEFATPYTLAYIDLPEGVRVLAPLADVAPEEVRIGLPVEVRVEPVRVAQDGRPVLGWRCYLRSDPEVRDA